VFEWQATPLIALLAKWALAEMPNAASDIGKAATADAGEVYHER